MKPLGVDFFYILPVCRGGHVEYIHLKHAFIKKGIDLATANKALPLRRLADGQGDWSFIGKPLNRGDRKMNVRRLLSTLALAVPAVNASAATIELTSEGASGTAPNGTLYSHAVIKSGTGIFGPFLRVHDGGNDSDDQEGYNGDFAGGGHPWETVGGTWTHPVRFGDLAYGEINGVGYYEFLLDINEPNGGKGTKQYISLDSVRIWASDVPKTADYEVDGLPLFGNPLYDMDSAGDVTVILNGGDIDRGSGRSDMAMYIPASFFAGVDADDYMTFYSLFGAGKVDGFDLLADGGFEEWSFRNCITQQCEFPLSGGDPSPVPLPGSLGLLSIGLAGLGLARRKTKA